MLLASKRLEFAQLRGEFQIHRSARSDAPSLASVLPSLSDVRQLDAQSRERRDAARSNGRAPPNGRSSARRAHSFEQNAPFEAHGPHGVTSGPQLAPCNVALVFARGALECLPVSGLFA